MSDLACLLILCLIIIYSISYYLLYRGYRANLLKGIKFTDEFIKNTNEYIRHLASSHNEVITQLEEADNKIKDLKEQLHNLLVYTDCLVYPSPILYMNRYRPDCNRQYQKGLEAYKMYRYNTKTLSSEEVSYINYTLHNPFVSKERDKEIENQKISMENRGYSIVSIDKDMDNTSGVFGPTRRINRVVFKEKDTYWAVYHDCACVLTDKEAIQVELIKDTEWDEGFWYPIYKEV